MAHLTGVYKNKLVLAGSLSPEWVHPHVHSGLYVVGVLPGQALPLQQVRRGPRQLVCPDLMGRVNSGIKYHTAHHCCGPRHVLQSSLQSAGIFISI